MTRYRKAVRWIAQKVLPYSTDSVETLTGYLTVRMVADLFNVPANNVATDVVKMRRRFLAGAS